LEILFGLVLVLVLVLNDTTGHLPDARQQLMTLGCSAK